ncbi:MAG: AAA domain-containing protein [Deltaproteobacteria bacterium]|nr:AAA domain-containing protein [Deltaproteobacteria bacterium]
MDKEELSFFDLLEQIKDFGAIKSPDFIALALPLLEEVCELHENNMVAFITSIDQIGHNNQKLCLNTKGKAILKADTPLFAKPARQGALDVSRGITESNDLDSHQIEQVNMEIHQDGKPIDAPLYMHNYKCWDHEKGHYNPLTDVFVLGQILASLAFNLDFRNSDDLELFVANRESLFFLNKNLHPTILNVIFEMTNLYVEERTANLEEVLTKLKNYREYNPENYVDLTQTEGFRNQDISERDNWILSKLKNRLFDISRRNKLLYFTDRQSFLNLTLGSVPLLLDYKNIREKDLIYWNDEIRQKLIKKKKLPLNSYLEFKENRFLATTLNKIRLEARKSKNEYGFSQLRTVIAFLHWYNFKENREERITSPLLLMPVEVIKKKGVEDQYTLNFSDGEAEINPVLSHYLKDLYDIALPDFIDLETTSIEDLVASIEKQIAIGGTGIRLKWRQKPRIQLIHSIAKKNFSMESKKLEKRSRGLNLRSFSYSYNKDDFQPLGLQIFNERIRHKNNALEYIINEDLNPADNFAVSEKNRTFYTTDNDGELNPLIWEIDTCNITLGNFNYRKMSLVRDYNEIINASIKNNIFEQLYSEIPKRVEIAEKEDEHLRANYPIILSDPTQSKAVQIARSGESYIIQGPPGTGKSQTITNLIADYIARDKTILFVCEKRAALDVVFHRLKNRKLDELCCLIHDSQADKKAFIQNLKETYTDFLEKDLDHASIGRQRDVIIDSLNEEINKISYFHQVMTDGDVPPLELFEVLHATGQGRTLPSEIELIHFPLYTEWKENREGIVQWFEQLKINDFRGYIADYPLVRLSPEILGESNYKAAILDRLNKCTALLDEFNEMLDDLDENDSDGRTISNWAELFELALKVKGLLQADKLSVFKPQSKEAAHLSSIKKDIDSKRSLQQDLEKQNHNWRIKFSKDDSEAALAQYLGFKKSIFRFINPNYYKLKSQINEAYDFDAHKIRPQVTTILEKLISEHEAEEQVRSLKKQAEEEFGLTCFDEEYGWIETMQQNPHEAITAWTDSDHRGYLQSLSAFSASFKELLTIGEMIFGEPGRFNLSELEDKLLISNKALNSLSAFVPFILNASQLSDEMRGCLYRKKWALPDFDYNLAYKSLAGIYEQERQFSDMDEDALRVSISRVNALLDKYYDSNVEAIRSKIRSQFLEKVRITESAAAQLSNDEKIAKKSLSSARRILENEFGKSMRYKSIRELTSSNAKELMTALKPVWLMSPLSVSDIMPIDQSIFDVVIYDEASQITVEEGTPSLFRAKQTIVVGDEMQMPPTNFFSTITLQDEEEEDIESKIGISLDADSLLNQSSRKLSSVMLGWHYRSRHESLISFSNAAFYKRELLTIPDSVIHHSDREPLHPIVDISQKPDITKVLDRSISFHYLENALYEKRKNKDEATYIASLTAEFLKQKVRKSIGIVAFSMEQQSEIEEALNRLAGDDPQFDTLLEEEYQREDEDQFSGLFVKNLENVQGDERDIIIMSVCYGYNSNGKMLMNFGPINRRGGEKRLNVIFSRARKHMVVVTSILPNEIKNDYNDGANYFKKFLSYAKHISQGELPKANLILDGMFSYGEQEKEKRLNPMILQLRAALEKKGYEVEPDIGQSHFKCDLGIKKPGENRYLLGILIDKREHYANENVLEQYCQKPEILNTFGWKVATVYAKDWLEKPGRVLERIEQLLSGKERSHKVDIEELIADKVSSHEPVNNRTEVTEDLRQETTREEKVEPEEENNAVDAKDNSLFERYEYVGGNSNKYWEINVEGTTVTVQYGRIGNRPQVKVKTFETNERALSEKKSMASKKLKKGYIKAIKS